MHLSKIEISKVFKEWLSAWDDYDLDGVMELLHEDVVFENWTCATICGKNELRKSWSVWFIKHGNFKFIEEDIFIDEQEQKMLFGWRLEWPSLEKDYNGKPEIRRGVDILHFKDGKIYQKSSYSKTTILINQIPVSLHAQNSNFIS